MRIIYKLNVYDKIYMLLWPSVSSNKNEFLRLSPYLLGKSKRVFNNKFIKLISVCKFN